MTRTDDEAFWRGQERRKKGQLGQPCCTQSKMSWAMIEMPGDFAVVIHGEQDCLNCFHHHTGASAHRFYSTRLTDHEITTGRTQEPLRHLLGLIARERAPEAVIVLGTCPVEVIGDRFEVVVAQVSEQTGVPMVALHTSGLALSTLPAMQDWLYATLAGLPQAAPVDRRWERAASQFAMSLLLDDEDLDSERAARLDADARALPVPGEEGARFNVIGLPDVLGAFREPVELLESAGLSVGGIFPHGATLNDWRTISHAAATFVVDRTMFPRLTEQLEAYDQVVTEVPLPIGPTQTTRFYRVIGETLGVDVEPVLAAAAEAARIRVASLRARAAGKRVALVIRVLNTYRVEQLAYEGLGDLEQLRDAGLEVLLLVQGPPEEAPKFGERLAARGFGDVPFEVFAGPFVLQSHLEASGVDLVVLPDSNRNLAVGAGLPFLPSHSFKPFFGGVAHNVRVLSLLLDRVPA